MVKNLNVSIKKFLRGPRLIDVLPLGLLWLSAALKLNKKVQLSYENININLMALVVESTVRWALEASRTLVHFQRSVFMVHGSL